MTNAGESAWQHMLEKAAHEFIRTERHLPLPVVVCVISPPECDHVVVKRNEPVVGDGDAVRVAREILQDVP